MYLAIREVRPLDDYLLLLTFENGEKRQFDMKPYLESWPVSGTKRFKLIQDR
jgi:hypothetical protein